MPEPSTIKGLQSLKTMGTAKKNAIPDKNTDFLKLYMLEKERTRLRNEQKRILLRLETINGRLKVIQNFYDEQSVVLQNFSNTESNQNSSDNEKEFKTMSIDY
ncbi:MAG: hypothetical protein WCR42_01805 [bacterium]